MRLNIYKGCKVQVDGCKEWYQVARVGQGYVTLFDFSGVVWFSSITDAKD